MRRAHLRHIGALGIVGLAACAPAATAEPPACPVPLVHRDTPDGTAPAHRDLATWLAAWPAAALDAVLLDPDAIAALDARNAADPAAFQDVLEPRPAAAVDAELQERLAWLADRLAAGDYIAPDSAAPARADRRARVATPVDTLHVVAVAADLRCVPTAVGYYRPSPDPAGPPKIDRDFDRNRCSALHVGELVRVVRATPDGRWRYVHAGHSVGWLEGPVLTPALDRATAAAFARPADPLVVVDDFVPTEAGLVLRMGAVLPRLGATRDGHHHHVLVPAPDGLRDDFVADTPAVHRGYLPLTRRNVLTTLLPRVGDPYGWGGTAAGRDCSRLLLDGFAAFGLHLGRHSGTQARAGVETLDVAALDEPAKRAAIRAAGARGVVFLYMPGHIMLYLGDLKGTPHALSAVSEYLVPCPGASPPAAGEPPAHQVVRLDRVDVTTLELGRDTARRAFIERITTVAILRPPSPDEPPPTPLSSP